MALGVGIDREGITAADIARVVKREELGRLQPIIGQTICRLEFELRSNAIIARQLRRVVAAPEGSAADTELLGREQRLPRRHLAGHRAEHRVGPRDRLQPRDRRRELGEIRPAEFLRDIGTLRPRGIGHAQAMADLDRRVVATAI